MSAEPLGAAWWCQQLATLERPDCIWVAYSGGLDSTVLLHSLSQAGQVPVKALHINHQLQAESGRWAAACRRKAARWGLQIEIRTVSCDASGVGPEAAARQARYDAIASLLTAGQCCAMAHHADDQAETVLFRLLRGAGVQGLAAMPALRPLGQGQLWRPLLALPRATLRDYAQHQRLRWVEDPQNQDPRYSRVWLRQKLIPQLERKFPGARQRLVQSADHCREAAVLLQEQSEQQLQRLLRADGGLDIAALARCTGAQQRSLLRLWLAQQGMQPSTQQLQRICEELIEARGDATPVFRLAEQELRRYRDGLWCMARLPPATVSAPVPLRRGRNPLPAGAGWLLVRGTRQKLPAMNWAFASGGERLKPAGGRHRRTLKALHQAAGHPPWLRERMPLIYLDGALVSVAGRWNSEACQALLRDAGLTLEWHHDLPGDPRAEKDADLRTP